MKKCLYISLVSFLLLGGAITGKGQTLEDVVLTGNGIPLAQDSVGSYVLILDGNPDTGYVIDYTIDTSSPAPPLEHGLCLKEPEGASEAELPLNIPGDYPSGTYMVSSCNTGEPELSFQLYVAWDVDRDGVTDDMDECPNSPLISDLGGTVVIDGCDSGVGNFIIEDGCTISDQIMDCAYGAGNRGEFVSCVSHLTNGLKPLVLSGAEKGAIQRCAAQSGTDALGQNRHRARYELAENDLVIPCVKIQEEQYLAVDMSLTYASTKNFHFKIKKAGMITQAEIEGIDDLEGTCAQYDLGTNSLMFPSLDIGGTLYEVQMKLLGANSANLHFKLQSITEVEE